MMRFSAPLDLMRGDWKSRTIYLWVERQLTKNVWKWRIKVHNPCPKPACKVGIDYSYFT